MRVRMALVLTFLFFTTSLFAKEVWLAVSGTANNVFFSDARVFNPNDKEITIQAYYLPRGNNNNSGEQPTSFTVAKRTMRIIDDIVPSLLHRGDVGAIRFVCPDDFQVTERFYAVTNICAPGAALPCTTGQFVLGLDVTTAPKQGAILQLKSNAKFRTNIGAANTTSSVAHVTWRLYDKAGAVVSKVDEELQPYGVLGPSNITGYFNNNTADLSDAWVGYVSDQPMFAYGSVVDNGSTDQTYVPGVPDTGTIPPDPTPTVKTVTVTARDFSFTVTTSAAIKQGDKVKFLVSQVANAGAHGFQLFDPNGTQLISFGVLGTEPSEQTITIPAKGTYIYVCSNSTCGTGHTNMTGELVVEEATSTEPPPRY
jgi:heme/copper-type cytochrome/quinol oxidase subunit 2